MPSIFRRLNKAIPERLSWYYIDSHQHIQGPFTGLEMDQWLQRGFFDDSLRIAFNRFTDIAQDFVELGQFKTNQDIFFDSKLTAESPVFMPSRRGDELYRSFFSEQDTTEPLLPFPVNLSIQ